MGNTHGKTKANHGNSIPTLAEAVALREQHERHVATLAERSIHSDVEGNFWYIRNAMANGENTVKIFGTKKSEIGARLCVLMAEKGFVARVDGNNLTWDLAPPAYEVSCKKSREEQV